MNNILEKIADELLDGLDLAGEGDLDIEKLRSEVINTLYQKIILQAVEMVDDKEKDNLVSALQNAQENVNEVMEVLQKYFSNIEDVIAQVMLDYKRELQNKFIKNK